MNSVEESRCGLENDDVMAEESNGKEAKGTFKEAGGVIEMRKKQVAYTVLDSSMSVAQQWWTFWSEELQRWSSKMLLKPLQMKA